MILIGMGGNLPTPAGPPRRRSRRRSRRSAERAWRSIARSRWYLTAPVPASDQPWFVNGVAAVATGLDPAALLALLHRIEARFGRMRRQTNEARPLDLDLLDYNGAVAGRSRAG